MIRNVSKYEVDKFVEKKYKLWLWWRIFLGVELMFIIGKIVKSVMIVYLFVIKIVIVLFVMYKLYLKGNFIVVSLLMLIKMMFIFDNLLKRIFIVMIIL